MVGIPVINHRFWREAGHRFRSTWTPVGAKRRRSVTTSFGGRCGSTPVVVVRPVGKDRVLTEQCWRRVPEWIAGHPGARRLVNARPDYVPTASAQEEFSGSLSTRWGIGAVRRATYARRGNISLSEKRRLKR